MLRGAGCDWWRVAQPIENGRFEGSVPGFRAVCHWQDYKCEGMAVDFVAQYVIECAT